MTNLYFVGGEDIDFTGSGTFTVSTNTSYFRSSPAFARCSLQLGQTSGSYYRANYPFSASSFWLTFRMGNSANATVANQPIFSLWSGTGLGFGVRRLFLAPTTTYPTSPEQWGLFKESAASVITQLGSSFNMSLTNNGLDKFDVEVVYSTTGSVVVFQNQNEMFSYSGDVTTDGNTAINALELDYCLQNQYAYFSEVIVTDQDTRLLSLQTLPPVINGNTHNFDTGYPGAPQASNVNPITINDTNFDGSSVAGQIDQYTVPSQAGTGLKIIGVAISSRMCAAAAGGPQHMDIGVHCSNGSDYWSPDIALTTTFTAYQDYWTTDPSTGLAWAALPLNIGLKSVT